MLVNNRDAERRLNSPDNLLNRLRRDNPRSSQAKNAMSLFVPAAQAHNQLQPNPFRDLTLSAGVGGESVTPSVYTPTTELESDEQVTDNAAEKVLDNLDIKVKKESVQASAMEVLQNSITALGKELPNINNPKTLAEVARKMSGVIVDINKNDPNKGKNGDKTVHLHFYTPERKKLEDFGEIIDVG